MTRFSSSATVLVALLPATLLAAPLAPAASPPHPPPPRVAAWARASLAGGELERELEDAYDELKEDLEELCDWCSATKLHSSRDEIFRIILRMDADDPRARRGLGHSRRPDGSWVEPDEPPDRDDRNESALERLPEKRREAVARFKETAFELFEEHRLDPFEGPGGELFDTILLVAPDDPDVRLARGQVEVGDAWISEDSARSLRRRAELQRIAASALERAAGEVRAQPIREAEASLGVDWTAILATDRVRVLGSGDGYEVERTVVACDAAIDLFRAVFGTQTPIWPGFSVYLIDDLADRETFLRSHPHVDERSREFLMQVMGGSLGQTGHRAEWDPIALRRLDSAARHTTSSLLIQEFQLSPEHGWAYDGFGLYLTWHVTGTRISRQVREVVASPDASDDLRVRLQRPDSNWMQEALDLMGAPDAPSVAEVLSLPVERMDARRMLLSYALAAWLLEAEPIGSDELCELLAKVGAGEPSDRLLASALDTPIAELDERLGRWLEGIATAGDRVEDAEVLGSELVDELAALHAPEEPPEWEGVSPSTRSAVMTGFLALDPAERERVVARILDAVREGGAIQVRLVGDALERASVSRVHLPSPTEFGAFDGRDFRGGPTRRVRGPDDRSWQAVRAGVRGRWEEPYPSSVRYEFATGKIVRVAAEGDESARALASLLDGVLPDEDLARAAIVAELDRNRPLHREATFFAHLYCDRYGNAFEGITLFEAWSTEGFHLEVPDVEAHAYGEIVWGDAEVPNPLSAEDQNLWYPRMADSVKDLARRTTVARALAGAWFQAEPHLPPDYRPQTDVLQGVIGIEDADLDRLRARWERDGGEFLPVALEEIREGGKEIWEPGVERRDMLVEGRIRVRDATLAVLADEGIARDSTARGASYR